MRYLFILFIKYVTGHLLRAWLGPQVTSVNKPPALVESTLLEEESDIQNNSHHQPGSEGRDMSPGTSRLPPHATCSSHTQSLLCSNIPHSCLPLQHLPDCPAGELIPLSRSRDCNGPCASSLFPRETAGRMGLLHHSHCPVSRQGQHSTWHSCRRGGALRVRANPSPGLRPALYPWSKVRKWRPTSALLQLSQVCGEGQVGRI